MRRHYLVLLALVGLPLGTLLAVNLIDYARFHLAVRRVEKLSLVEKITLADYCRKVERLHRFEGKNAPAAFQLLKPIKGTLYPGCSDAQLYALGEAYLELRVSTSPLNQEIVYFTNSNGPQRTQVIWNRNPEHVRRLNPPGRIATVRMWSMSGTLEWLVLADRLMVIERPGKVGLDDTLLASVSLNSESFSSIKTALNAMDPAVRGKHYASDTIDGTHLHICFGADGEKTANDIVIENTWVEAVGPLLRTVSSLSPKEHPIPFEQSMKARDFPSAPMTVMSLPEWEMRAWGHPRTPWWCVWRSILEASRN